MWFEGKIYFWSKNKTAVGFVNCACLSHFGKIPAKSLTPEMGFPSPSLLLPGQSLFLTPTAERKKKKSKQLLYPKICCQSRQRRGRRPGGMSEFWSNFQTKAAERSRGQGPRFEGLMRIAQSTALSGQAAPLFSSWVSEPESMLTPLPAHPPLAQSHQAPYHSPQVCVWEQNPRLSLLRASCCC